jgi:hypothetical protein
MPEPVGGSGTLLCLVSVKLSDVLFNALVYRVCRNRLFFAYESAEEDDAA